MLLRIEEMRSKCPNMTMNPPQKQFSIRSFNGKAPALRPSESPNTPAAFDLAERGSSKGATVGSLPAGQVDGPME